MIKLFVISGDGIGAGKTTLARQLGQEVWSLAGALRDELKRLYPGYDWENRTQVYKDTTIVREAGRKTVRHVTVEHGEFRCFENPEYWVEKLADKLEGTLKLAMHLQSVAIDDCRKVCEVAHLRQRFPGQVLHIHVRWNGATPEPEFENSALAAIADYTIMRTGDLP